MTTLPIKLVADQGAPGDEWPVVDAAAITELQATVAALADVVAALSSTLNVTGTVAVSNQPTIPTPQTDSLTNTQLRATAVPVSVANQPSQPLTNTQLRQSPVPVAGVFGDENGVPFSDINPLPVDFGGSIAVENLSVQYDSHISTANSTDTPLLADEVFIGTWEDVKNFASISASILTDAGSTFNGAVAEFSADGINVMTRQAATVPAGLGGFFSFAPQGRYFRINYTNGPAPQTSLEVEVKYSFNPPAISQSPLGALTTDASITTGTTAALQGRIMAGPMAGVWQPIGTDGAGNLQVAATGSVEVTNHPVPQTDGLTDTELRATPLPVDVDFPATQDVSGNVTVDGTVSVSNPVTDVTVSNFPATQPVSGTVTVANPTAQGLTDTELRATPLPVTGSVTVADDSGPLTVDGTVTVSNPVNTVGVSNFPATQAVTGTVTVANPTAQGLTDAQIRATPLPVSGSVTVSDGSGPLSVDGTVSVGNFPATQPVSGTVTVANPTAQGLTDAQLRASALPVSGTVAVSNPGLTDAQLRASVVGVVNQTGRALALPPVKATVTAVGDTIVHTPAAGKRVRLLWTYAINDPTSATAPLIKVSLGAAEQLRVWAVSKSQVLEGPVDGPIIVNLDVAARVAFTAFIEEF